MLNTTPLYFNQNSETTARWLTAGSIYFILILNNSKLKKTSDIFSLL